MKHSKLFLSLFIVAIFIANRAFSQESAFDKEVKPWHKKATMACGMLRDMKTFDQQKMLSNLAELESELKPLTEKYTNNPPKEYASDLLWKTYFEDLADNMRIVRERIERKEYRLAQKYCGQFCMTFGNMHRTNGRVTLTDLLFSFRMEVKNTMDMENAGNLTGAKARLHTIADLQEKIGQSIAKSSPSQLDQLQQPLMVAYKQWSDAVEKGVAKDTETAFATFMNEFPKLYGATF